MRYFLFWYSADEQCLLQNHDNTHNSHGKSHFIFIFPQFFFCFLLILIYTGAMKGVDTRSEIEKIGFDLMHLDNTSPWISRDMEKKEFLEHACNVVKNTMNKHPEPR